MTETLTVRFTEKDERDLRTFKQEVWEFPDEEHKEPSESNGSMKRRRITMPAIEAPTEKEKERLEKGIEEGDYKVRRDIASKMPSDMVESVKASFIASGGNISEVSALHDLTPEAVVRLAAQEEWPVYGGGTTSVEKQQRAQLRTLRDKIWHKIEAVLESLNIEKKQKADIVQHRTMSEYVESLSSRNSVFKNLMDQYMRIGALLEPEVYANDPEGSNWHARQARGENHPGGEEGVNRELANFFTNVITGLADKVKERDMENYGEVIDARVEKE